MGLRLFLRACGSCAAVLLASFALAEPNPHEATSSRDAKEEAIRHIPWSELTAQQQRTTRYVVRKPSLFRRTPTLVFDCKPQVFNFLTQHPEVVVNVWNLMGVSTMSLTRTSDETFRAADQAGAQGALRVLHAHYEADSTNTVLIFAEGKYKAAAMPSAIKARCVLLLRSASRQETNGRTYITARLDTFVRFDRAGTDLIARTLRPLLVKSADHNFTETMKFVSTFSRTAEERPDGLINLSTRLERIDPTTRSELSVLCRQTGATGATPTAFRSGTAELGVVRLQSLEE